MATIVDQPRVNNWTDGEADLAEEVAFFVMLFSAVVLAAALIAAFMIF